MFYEQVFRELYRRQIKYLVIGGVAVNLHGYSRITGDLDVMLSFDRQNVLAFINMVKDLKWRPRIPVNLDSLADPKARKLWIKEKNMKVFSVYNPKNEPEHIDVMVEDYIPFEKAYKNRLVVPVGDYTISIVSIPDLIKLKTIAGRGRDQVDIGALKKLLEIQGESKSKKNKKR